MTLRRTVARIDRRGILRPNEPVPTKGKRRAPKVDGPGRPTLFEGPSKRTISITNAAFAKAKDDAEILSAPAGFKVTTSQAIEAAIRSFDASKFKR